MSLEPLLDAATHAGLLAAWLLAPVLLASALAGLLSGLLSAMTGWSEGALGHTVRVVFVGLAWLLSAAPIAAQLQQLSATLWGPGP